jgi:succinate-acetate transporter protein
LQLGLIPPEEGSILALVLGAFVFPPLAVAAILAFLTREGLGATALGLISFSWLSTAIILYASPPPATSNVLGILSLIVAVILLLLSITAVFGKPILAGFILLAVARYSLNGIYELTEMAGVQTASGYLGLVIFAASLYGGLAFGLEDVQHKTVLPLGRRGEALQAFEGDLSEQVGPVEQEAGVRKQL